MFDATKIELQHQLALDNYALGGPYDRYFTKNKVWDLMIHLIKLVKSFQRSSRHVTLSQYCVYMQSLQSSVTRAGYQATSVFVPRLCFISHVVSATVPHGVDRHQFSF